MKTLKYIALTFLAIGFVFGGFYFDFKIWKLKHPGAPGWTYIFKH